MSAYDIPRTRILNDAFRTTFEGGKVTLSYKVSELPPDTIEEIVGRVQTFTDWTEDNDPEGEHNFGNFSLGDLTIWFKIDYYDKNYGLGSVDPADPNVTGRLLTILFPEEY